MHLGKTRTADLFGIAIEQLALARDNYFLALHPHDPLPKCECWPDALKHIDTASECIGHLQARLTDYQSQAA